MFDANYVVAKLHKEAALAVIGQEVLDPNGNIDPAIEKLLIEKQLMIEALDGIDGADKPISGEYIFDQ